LGLREPSILNPDEVIKSDGMNDPDGGVGPRESVGPEGAVDSKVAVNSEVATDETQLFLSMSSSISILLVLTPDSCLVLSSLVICESGKAGMFRQKDVIRLLHDTFETKRKYWRNDHNGQKTYH
jgi:hypothetical protein